MPERAVVRIRAGGLTVSAGALAEQTAAARTILLAVRRRPEGRNGILLLDLDAWPGGRPEAWLSLPASAPAPTARELAAGLDAALCEHYGPGGYRVSVAHDGSGQLLRRS